MGRIRAGRSEHHGLTKLRRSCTLMALWHYGIMALWHYGIMALWHYGIMAYGVRAFTFTLLKVVKVVELVKL